MKKLVIFGTGDVARMAYNYFYWESDYVPIGFTVDRQYMQDAEFMGLPLHPWEHVQEFYPPDEHSVFVAVGYRHLNYLRTAKFLEAQDKGYELANFISPRACVANDVELGRNVMIQEFNNLQYGVKIEDNVMLWASNHIGHGTVIQKNVYVASHVVISGFCDIGRNTFVGVNATISDNVKIGMESLISANCYVNKSLEGGKVYAVAANFRIKNFTSLSVQNRKMFDPYYD